MGNELSQDHPLFLSPELKWKTGSKDEVVPFSFKNVSQVYDNLTGDPELKSYLINHIDWDYLVNSCISNSCDDNVLLQGIKRLKKSDPEADQAIDDQIRRFEDCVSAGIEVKVSEALEICEKSIDSSFKVEEAPFLISFQKRLACLRSLEEFIRNERKVDQESKSCREYASSCVNSDDHPQLKTLMGLKNTSLGLLKAFPVCYRAIDNSEHRSLLTDPVQELCRSVCDVDDLELYPCWSPAVKHPVKVLNLNNSKVNASLGFAKSAVDGGQESFWSCQGGKWSVSFDSPQDITAVRIAWISGYLKAPFAANNIGAPKRLAIFVGKVDEKGTQLPLSRVACLEPEKEKHKQGSWIQTYSVDMSDVTSLHVVLSSQVCPSNKQKCCKMYNFEVIRKNSKVVWVDTLSLLKQMQSSLFPLLEFPEIMGSIFDSMLSLVRTSGSLSLLLMFVKSLLKQQTMDRRLKDEAPRHFFALLSAIHSEDSKVRTKINDQFSNSGKTLVKVEFDANLKTQNCKITDQGATLVNSEETSFLEYGCLTVPLTKGMYEWEIEIAEAPEKELSIAIGLMDESSVKNRSSTPRTLAELGQVWLVVPKDEAKSATKDSSSTYYAFARMKRRDVCRFVYSAGAKTLSLFVNGAYQGIKFEQVPSTVKPVVVFFKSSKIRKVSVLSCNFMDIPNASVLPVATSPPWDLRPKPDLRKTFDHSPSAVCLLLRELQELVATKSKALEKENSKLNLRTCSLEFPFCVEISSEVLETLTCLLKQLAGSPEKLDDQKTSMITALLDTMNLQFHCLTLSRVQLSEVGLSVCENKNPESEDKEVLVETAAVLKSLFHSEQPQIRDCAVRAFSRGAALFLPAVEDKAELAVSILQELFSVEKGCVDDTHKSKFLLLLHLVQCFQELEEITKVLTLVKKTDARGLYFVSMLTTLLDLLAGHEVSKLQQDSQHPLQHLLEDAKDLSAEVLKVTCRFQEQLLYETLSTNVELTYEEKENLSTVLLCYCGSLLRASTKVLSAASKSHGVVFSAKENELKDSTVQSVLRQSMLCKLLQPLLYSLGLNGYSLHFLQRLLPFLTLFFEHISKYCAASDSCRTSLELFYGTIKRKVPLPSNNSGVGGWKVIKAAFDEGDSSFTVGENGSTFTSVHSSNTCALVNVKFTATQKAAWVFSLESDSLSDECSVFGAARMPLSSRCYSSSPDLWMRRAYNGYMYCHGQTTGLTMDKIHPGDLVRIEFDGPAGTLSFSINGGEPEVGFSDITDDIYPACGSYRNGVVVKLVKVEVFDYMGSSDTEKDDELAPSENVNWVIDEEIMASRDPSLLGALQTSDKKAKAAQKSSHWVTSRADRGCLKGRHEWSFELQDPQRSRFAVGIVAKEHKLNGKERLASNGSYVVGGSVPNTPVVSSENETSRLSESSLNLDSHKFDRHSFAWCSDGSLWCDGIQCSRDFGLSVFPLPKLSTITMQVNRSEGTITYYVNGSFVGVAFGPEGSGAAVTVGVPNFSVFYPAGSIFSSSQMLKIKATGFHGSTIFPVELSLQKATASVLGRLSSLLIRGLHLDETEKLLLPWLHSPLLIGGLEEGTLNTLSKQARTADWSDALAEARREMSDLIPKSPSVPELGAMSESQEKGKKGLKEQDEAKGDPSVKQNAEASAKESNAFIQKVACAIQPDQSLSREASLLLEWLEQIEAEPVFLRKALERTGAFRFPKCEMPFIGCLLKHGNLVREAMAVVELTAKGESAPTPSEEMKLLWQRVKQLRNVLRQQRQSMKAIGNLNEEKAQAESFASGETEEGTREGEEEEKEEKVEGETALYYSEHIQWLNQSDPVRAVGVDFGYELLFLRAQVEGDSAQSVGKVVDQCSLSLGELKYYPSDHVVARVDDNKFQFCVRFDLSAVENLSQLFRPLSDLPPLKFCLTEVISVDLQLPEKTDLQEGGGDSGDSSAAMSKFDEVIENIAGKSLFLLQLVPVVHASDVTVNRSKTLLLDLTKKYSGNIPISGTKAELSRWKSQERWKRVIEFLHVHSKIRRQMSPSPSNHMLLSPTRLSAGYASPHVSTSALSLHQQMQPQASMIGSPSKDMPVPFPSSVGADSSVGLSADSLQLTADISPTQAAMQACTIFITTDEIVASPADLHLIIRRRLERANMRSYGMQALNTVMQMPILLDDPFGVFQLLLHTKSAIASHEGDEVTSENPLRPKIHYLTNLEGCTAVVLSKVQGAFIELFSSLSAVFSQYLFSWKNHCVAACEGNDFTDQNYVYTNPSEQVQFTVTSKSTHILLIPIFSIMDLWTLHFSNRDHRWIHKCGFLSSLFKLLSLIFQEKVAQTWTNVALKLMKFFQNNAEKFPNNLNWNLWSQDYVNQGLRRGNITCRSLLLHLSQVPMTVLTAEERAHLGLDQEYRVLREVLGMSQISYLFNQVLCKINRRNERMESEKKLKLAEEAEQTNKLNKELMERLTPCGVFDSRHKGSDIRLSEGNQVAILRSDESGTALCVFVTMSDHYQIDFGPENSGNYFEVTVLLLGRGDIGVGLADVNNFPETDYMPGWEAHSYGYHGDDGRKFGAHSTPGEWPMFELGDVIGCGINMATRTIFYTRNGTLLGDAFTDVCEDGLWPVVGFSNRHDETIKVKVNCGAEPFLYEGPEVLLSRAVRKERKLREEESAVKVQQEADEKKSGELSSVVDGKKEDMPEGEKLLELQQPRELCDVVCTNPEDFGSTLSELKSHLRAADAYIYEYSTLRSYSSLILRFILILSNQMDASSEELDNEQEDGNTSNLAKPVLRKDISLFGTPKFVTSADGTHLQEGILSSIIHELLIGTNYLNQVPKESSDETKSMAIPTCLGGSIIPNFRPFIPEVSLSKLLEDLLFESGGQNDTPQFDHGAAVLEKLEVEAILHGHLVTLSSLSHSSKAVKQELCRTKALRTLLSVLHSGSVRNRTIAGNLLVKILPNVTPDQTEEALIPEWKHSIDSFEESLSQSSYRRRQRRMPDGVIQGLMLSTHEAFSVQEIFPDFTVNQPNVTDDVKIAVLPYWIGDSILFAADQKLSLIQRLFEAPLWTELVASNITEALRNAGIALRKLSQGGVQTKVKQADLDVVTLACAACASLCGLGSLRMGAKIQMANASTGVLVSIAKETHQADVVFDSNLSDFSSVKHVETVDRTIVQPLMSGVRVDLSRLSQPLLSHFFVLVKQLLEWFLGSKHIFEDSEAESEAPEGLSCLQHLALRLTSVVSMTLSVLLANQTDVITDFLHDADILSDIVKISLIPNRLPYLPGVEVLHEMWLFAQARRLEIMRKESKENEKVRQLAKHLGIPVTRKQEVVDNIANSLEGLVEKGGGVEENKILVTEEVNELITDSDVLNKLPIEELKESSTQKVSVTREEFEAMVRRLSVEFQVDPRICAIFLQHSMSDEACARDRMTAVKNHRGIEEKDYAALISASSDAEAEATFSDDNPLKNIDHTPAAAEERWTLEDIPAQRFLDLVSHRAACPKHAALDSYIIESSEEGSVTSRRNRIGVTSNFQLNEPEVISYYFANDLGVVLSELVPVNTHRVITHFYGQKVEEMAGFVTRLDVAMTVLRLRSVSSRLLLEGNFNLPEDMSSIQDWCSLLKIVSATENPVAMDKNISSLSSALISRAACFHTGELETGESETVDEAEGDSLESRVVNILAADASEHLKMLTNGKLQDMLKPTDSVSSDPVTGAVVAEDKASGEQYWMSADPIIPSGFEAVDVQSPHPFFAPSDFSGEIRIPSNWKGINVSFHSKCSTPSEKAYLEIFLTKECRDGQTPTYVFSGNNQAANSLIGVNKGQRRFTDFSTLGLSSIYYRFVAEPLSDCTPLEVIPLSGPIAIEGKICKVQARVQEGKKVGLGEDDTLFNLFDDTPYEDAEEELTAAGVCGLNELGEGLWYFESTVLLLSGVEGSKVGRVGVVSTPFDGDGLEVGGTRGSAAYAGSGEVVLEGTCSPSEVLTAWELHDVIGCLFVVNSHEIQVYFSKNGKWETKSFTFIKTCATACIKPSFSMCGETKLSVNFGEDRFSHFNFDEVLGPEKGMVRAVISRPPSATQLDAAWGYHFQVSPIVDLGVHVCKEYQLIWHSKPEDHAGGGAATSNKVWIWRPRSNMTNRYCGDIVTTKPFPPRRTILIPRGLSRAPTSFKCVFFCAKTHFTVWRAVPPEGFAALGDIVNISSHRNPPALENYACVPLWTLQRCNVNKAMFVFKKAGDTKAPVSTSLWLVDNGLGYFFGSPCLSREYQTKADSRPKHEEFKCDGIGEGYQFTFNVRSLLDGEWSTDEEVLSQPSLFWCCNMLRCLLDDPRGRSKVLSDEVFRNLVKYLRSSSSPAPLKVVPVLIQMVRLAQKEKVSLPLDEVKNLCKCILAHAMLEAEVNNKVIMSRALMSLVDFVVEIQAAHIADAASKEVLSILSDTNTAVQLEAPVVEVLGVRAAVESKEEDPDHVIETKEGEPPLVLSTEKATPTEVIRDQTVLESERWWERSASKQLVKEHRAIKRENLDNLFSKESVLLRLRQVLKFLHAIGYPHPAGQHVAEHRAYPKFMSTKIWFEHVSRCRLVETTHPYKPADVTRKLVVPGADKLTVTFDRRFQLRRGDKLTLVPSAGNPVVFTSLSSESYIGKCVVFTGSELTYSFQCQSPQVEEEGGGLAWGWAFLAFASGNVLEEAHLDIPLSSPLTSLLETPPFVEGPVGGAATEGENCESNGELLRDSSTLLMDELANELDSTPVPTPIVDPTVASFNKATTPTPVEMLDPTEEAMLAGGRLVTEGVLTVPHASLLRTKLKRSGQPPSSDSADAKLSYYIRVIDPTDGSFTVRSVIGSSFVEACVVKNSSIKYQVYCMDSKQLQERVTEILAKRTAEENLKKALMESLADSKHVAPRKKTEELPSEPAKEEEKPAESSSVEPTTDPTTAVETQPARIDPTLLEWQCAICTLLNPPHLVNCSLCMTVRPDVPVANPDVYATDATAGEAPTTSVTSAPIEAMAGWWCNACTFINPHTIASCAMCGTAATPNPAVPTPTEPSMGTRILSESSEESSEEEEDDDQDDDDEDDDDEDEDDDDDDDEEESETISMAEEEWHSEAAAHASQGESGGKPAAGTDPKVEGTTIQIPAEKQEQQGDHISITVTGQFTDADKFETLLEHCVVHRLQEQPWVVRDYALTPSQLHQRLSKCWTSVADEILLEYMNSKKKKTENSGSAPQYFALPKNMFMYRGMCLANLSVLDMQMRMLLIEAFNKNLQSLLSFIDLGNDDPYSLGAMIRKSNRYLLMKVKNPLLEKALNATVAYGGGDIPASIVLDNFKAIASRENCHTDPSTSTSCFVQAFRQLNQKDSALFRHIISGDRVFLINFVGESGIDAGGVFREGASRIVEDLFTDEFNLLLLCPNGLHVVHTNMDKYIPNPKHTGPLAMEMFEFIGKLMAMSIRAKLCLPFEFPQLIWKKLVGEEVSKEDLTAIDIITVKYLDSIRDCHEDAVDPVTSQEDFKAKFGDRLRFVFTGSDKVDRELIRGGQSKPVTFENRIQYVELVEQARLKEFDLHIAAIAKGMGEVVPMRALLLFSSAQLEELVCGNPSFDMDLWKSNTETSGVSSKTVALFWKVMESLTQKEHAGFVRFAWGRSRLPHAKDFTVKMRLTSGGRAALPVAHTCFFSIELPDYRTEEEMRHGLLTAIHYGAGGILNS